MLLAARENCRERVSNYSHGLIQASQSELTSIQILEHQKRLSI